MILHGVQCTLSYGNQTDPRTYQSSLYSFSSDKCFYQMMIKCKYFSNHIRKRIRLAMLILLSLIFISLCRF